MSGNFDDLVEYRMNRSFETLEEAQTMLDHDFWNASVNRVYYACFYAVSALLYKKGLRASSHKGIRQMFGLHFVKNGIIRKEFGRFFNDLYDRRQTGDYDDFIQFDKETSMKLFLLGKEFVSEIDLLLKKL
jgi:uncharacterized protein (UPF0332 family)